MKRYIVVTILAATSAASIATGQWVDRRFWLPDSFPEYTWSSYVVQNRRSGRMYLGGINGSREFLHIFDPGSGTKYGFQDSVSECPAIVHCPGAGRVWASIWDSYSHKWLYGFDDVLDSLVSVVPASDHHWWRLCYNPSHNELYGVDDRGGGLYSLDPLSAVIRDSTGLAEVPDRLVWESRHNYLFCAQVEGDSGVECIDCSTLTSLGPVPGTIRVTDLALHPTEPKLYCIAYDDVSNREVLRIVDTDSLSVVDSIVLPLSENWFYDGRIDICRRTNRLYCRYVFEGDRERSQFQTWDTIAIIDISADSLVRMLGLPAHDDEPRRIACNEVIGKVYVGYVNMGYTIVIDQGDSICALLPFGYADDVCWDSLHNRLYIGSDAYHFQVTVLDGLTDSVVSREDYAGVTPERMFWSGGENRMYVTVWDGIGEIAADSLNHWQPLRLTSSASAYSSDVNRLYVVGDTGGIQHVFVYDCTSDSIVCGIRQDGGARITLIPEVRKLYMNRADTTLIYDILADSIIGMRRGFPPRLHYNAKDGRAYDPYGRSVAVVDVQRDTVLRVVNLGRDIEFAAFDTAANELWLKEGLPGRQFLVVDCNTMQVVDSVYYGVVGWYVSWSSVSRKLYAFDDADSCVAVSMPERRVVARLGLDGRIHPGLYDGRSDRLYISSRSDSALVLGCRTDSVTASIWLGGVSEDYQPCFAIGPDREVWIAMGKGVTVVRDTAAAIGEWRGPCSPPGSSATIIRDVLCLSASSVGRRTSSALLDISGRKVLDLLPGPNDVRHLAPGVYFVRASSAASSGPSAVTKVIVTR